MIELKYYIFLDDSGNLHHNSGDKYFFYGGLIVNELKLPILRNNYRTVVEQIISSNKNHYGDEIKGSNIRNKHRKHLLQNLKKNNQQIFIKVEQDKYPGLALKTPKDIVRYKNYTIKFLVVGLFLKGYFADCTELILLIDNQNIAVSAKDSLVDYLYNSINFEKYLDPVTNTREKVSKHDISVKVKYCDSKNHYLVQAADLLANTMWREYEKGISFSTYLQKNAHFVDFSKGTHLS